MKVRIKPEQSLSATTRYYVQCKKWWGWKTIATRCTIKFAFEFVEELKSIAKVEFILLS